VLTKYPCFFLKKKKIIVFLNVMYIFKHGDTKTQNWTCDIVYHGADWLLLLSYKYNSSICKHIKLIFQLY